MESIEMSSLAFTRMSQISLKNSGTNIERNSDEEGDDIGTPNPLVNGAVEPQISGTFRPIDVAVKPRCPRGFQICAVRRSRGFLAQKGRATCRAVPHCGIPNRPMFRAISLGAR
jgi:hypothetical protein